MVIGIMRSPDLDPFFASLATLKGVGPATQKLLEKLLGEAPLRLIDLLLHLPSRAVDRHLRPGIVDCAVGETVTVRVWIDRHRPAPPGRSNAPHRTMAHDAAGDLLLVWFGGSKARLEAMAPVGEERIVSGTIQLFDGVRQIVHPDFVLPVDAFERLPKIEAVYPLTAGLHGGALRRAIGQALTRLPTLPEWLSNERVAADALPSFATALRSVHWPHDLAHASPTSAGWRRLALDELTAHQLALGLTRGRERATKSRLTAASGAHRRAIVEALPFQLTQSQQRAVADILADMAAPKRMMRLVQGDVGSGKTLVALLAMAQAAEAGRQAALLAPTEILARQHHARLSAFAEPAGLEVGLLTGREKAREREAILARLRDGTLPLVVGTHALIQPQVAFADLALAVIDEQHRFGVRQRAALADKGDGVDMLLMTATPIPRSLVLTYFGDTDASNLTEKPPGRQSVDTRVLPLARLSEVVDALHRALSRGERVYWVCPLVNEQEDAETTAATERFASLESVFGADVALVHGQMPGKVRDLAMERFRTGDAKILVATTVIEVGVDVPEASIMVIEGAENFGLAQLHQLRGRIGRGAARSTCLLLYSEPLGELARERLRILRESDDGFRIAEEDLRLRGEGDVLGERQSGMPGFRVARLGFHADLLEQARAEARELLGTDPALASPRGKACRNLLYLFGHGDSLPAE